MKNKECQPYKTFKIWIIRRITSSITREPFIILKEDQLLQQNNSTYQAMTSINIKFSEDQILHKLKTINDADKALKTDFPLLDAISAISKIDDPKILEKEFNVIITFNPILICRLDERIRFITDIATHQSGTTNPVFVACNKNVK
jgi:hypothetical protein